MNNYKINDELTEKLSCTFKNYSKIEKAMIFDSGINNKPGIALFGNIKQDDFTQIQAAFDNEAILFFNYDDIEDKVLRKSIKKHGANIYTKETYGYVNYCPCTFKMGLRQ